MSPPTIPADVRLRTRLLGWEVGVLVMGAGCLLFLNGYLNHLLALSTATPKLAAEQFHHLAVLVAVVVWNTHVTAGDNSPWPPEELLVDWRGIPPSNSAFWQARSLTATRTERTEDLRRGLPIAHTCCRYPLAGELEYNPAANVR